MRPSRLRAAFLLIPLTLTGCEGNDPIKLNDNIVNANDRLVAAFDAFGNAVSAAVDRKPAKMAEVDRAYESLKITVASIKAETPTWKVPSSASAKKLLDCHNELMVIQEDMIKDCGAIMKMLDDKDMPRDRKAKAIDSLLQDQNRRNIAAFADLQEAQREFAREHHFKMAPPKKRK
jgi:hypothetical protein